MRWEGGQFFLLLILVGVSIINGKTQENIRRFLKINCSYNNLEEIKNSRNPRKSLGVVKNKKKHTFKIIKHKYAIWLYEACYKDLRWARFNIFTRLTSVLSVHFKVRPIFTGFFLNTTITLLKKTPQNITLIWTRYSAIVAFGFHPTKHRIIVFSCIFW